MPKRAGPTRRILYFVEEPLRYDALTNTLLKNKVFIIKALELSSVCAARCCMFETKCVWRHLND